MEAETLVYSSLITILFLIALHCLFPSKKNLPPGPPWLPIIGNGHLLKAPFHLEQLRNLANKYGPVMSLYLGPCHTIIVSSASVARECFTKNDVILANRPKTPLAIHVGYNNTSFAGAPYGAHWQNLRRLVTNQLWSSSQINSNNFVQIRKDEVKQLLLKLFNKVGDHHDDLFTRVGLRSMVWSVNYNITMRMVTGQGHEDDSDKEKQLKKLIYNLNRLDGFRNGMNVFFPILNFVTGYYEKKVINVANGIDGFLQALIEEEHRRRNNNSNKRGESMINNLVSLQEDSKSNADDDHYNNDVIIKGLLLEAIIPGSDSSSVTIEWAMSYLLNHPQALHKAKQEIDAQVGQHRLLEESDLPKLHYLESIMSESVRLNPTFPFLVPRKPSADCTIGGYHVPCGTMVLINTYAIHRDPKIWGDDFADFRPERFEYNKEDQQEVDKLLLPFGLGRRSCPASRLAQRQMSLVLGSLIQCFEWKRASDEKVDMTGGEGLTMPKAQALEAMCKVRSIIKKLLKAT